MSHSPVNVGLFDKPPNCAEPGCSHTVAARFCFPKGRWPGQRLLHGTLHRYFMHHVFHILPFTVMIGTVLVCLNSDYRVRFRSHLDYRDACDRAERREMDMHTRKLPTRDGQDMANESSLPG